MQLIWIFSCYKRDLVVSPPVSPKTPGMVPTSDRNPANNSSTTSKASPIEAINYCLPPIPLNNVPTQIVAENGTHEIENEQTSDQNIMEDFSHGEPKPTYQKISGKSFKCDICKGGFMNKESLDLHLIFEYDSILS